MRDAVGPAALGFAAAAAGMFLMIVAGRLVRDRRVRRVNAIRPDLELALALYLADETAPPPAARSRTERRTLEAVALEALDELQGSERTRLTRLLEELGIVGDAARRLRSRRRIVRRRAAESLSEMESAEAADALLAALSDRDLDVRIACAHALAGLGDHDLVPKIAETLAEAVGRRTGPVEEVLLVLGSTDPRSLQVVLDSSRSLALYRLVTRVVGALRLTDFAPFLRDNLAVDDDELAARAARGLGLIGDLAAFESLLTLAADERRPEPVRVAATTALGRLGDERAVPALEHLLHGADWSLQESAARALSNLGDTGSDVLHRAAGDSSPARAHALAVLA